jgi:hypothetical protein
VGFVPAAVHLQGTWHGMAVCGVIGAHLCVRWTVRALDKFYGIRP